MTLPQTSIRAYAPEHDLAALSAIWLRASTRAHPFLGAARLRRQQRDVETIYLPAATSWVAWTDQRPVGFVSLLENFVGGLFVDPDHQGRGIGGALMAHVMGQHSTLALEVYTANTRAMAFYHRLGFREMSRRNLDDEGLAFETARLRFAR